MSNIQIDGIERRNFAAPLEIRAEGEGEQRFGGLACRFGSRYDMGWFTEEIDSRAFDGVDFSDVVVLLNHDENIVLGRVSAGTASVRVTPQGLEYEFAAPNSPNGQNVAEMIKRGDVTQSSWSFSVLEDKWLKQDDGKDHRTITKARKVYDTAPVTFPANTDTTVAKRSMMRQFSQDEGQNNNKQTLSALDAHLTFRKRQTQLLN